MLHSLSLESFRSWEDRTTLRVGRLTLLAGPNNVGKSSFLGALKALIQSEQSRSKDELLLSGEWVDLGPFDQLLPASRRGGGFSIGLIGEGADGPIDAVWDFEASTDPSKETARMRRLEALVASTPHAFDLGVDASAVTAGERLPLILADPSSFLATAGPRKGELVHLLPYRPEQVQSVGPFRAPPDRGVYVQRRGSGGPSVGRYGEYAAEIAWYQGSRHVDVLPPDDGPLSDRFDRAISRWYSYILGQSFDLRVEELRRYGYKVIIGSPGAEDLTFVQVGYGLSQIWPIVVTALTSGAEDLVLVETPEAHLHPAAQHRLARLFVELASRGRQVVVETHSEHVVAAVCLAVKDARIAPESVVVHFFQQRDGQTEVTEVPVDQQGRRLLAPEGFFDQASIEMLELLR